MSGSEINLDLPKIAATLFAVFKLLSIAGLVFCLYGLGASIHQNYPLWLDARYAEGTIVDYKEISWESRNSDGSSSPTSGKFPVVTFQDSTGALKKFTDNFAHGSSSLGAKVNVIYSPNAPDRAMVDKGIGNWLATIIWLFGVVCSLLGIKRFSKVPALGNNGAIH